VRTISDAEYLLITELFVRLDMSPISFGLSRQLKVEELADGGMGSIRFIHPESTYEQRSLGQSVVEGEFQDADGVVVSMAINVDKQNKLYELDLWKVDFSPLRRYPDPTEVTRLTRSSIT
jgi:hypothetical protein